MLCSLCAGVVVTSAVVGFIILIIQIFLKPKTPLLKMKHIVVTGGSLGIGKCVAIQAARRGAHVTIIARNVENLEAAVSEIKAATCEPASQQIQYISLDLSNNFEAMEKAISELEENVGPVFMLVNCAGTSFCGRLEDLTDKDIKYLVNLNILGTIFPCKVLVPRMKARKEGHIVITGSQAGLLGIFGFTAYCATKFAVRGFAEALQMEVKPHNIHVTLALPPDTDTPGFAEEQKTKPLETRLISESAGIVSPDVVATQILDDAQYGNFFSTVGFESAMVTSACAGMAPFSSYLELGLQICSASVLRLVSVLVLNQFNRIVSKCQRDRDNNKKAE